MAEFLETNYKLPKYAAVSYKHNSGDAGKSMEGMNYPSYMDPKEYA